jgi:hypothetical protein
VFLLFVVAEQHSELFDFVDAQRNNLEVRETNLSYLLRGSGSMLDFTPT